MRPTGNILGLALLLLALWYAGASQGNGAAYLLCFLVVGVAAVSVVHTWRNLRGLRVRAEAVNPVFAGGEALLPIEVFNDGPVAHHGITIRLDRLPPLAVGEIPAGAARRVEIPFTAGRRGEHVLGRIALASRYPVGLFEAARAVASGASCIVYPAPAGSPVRPASGLAATARGNEARRVEGDDFAGVRPYRAGESQRHIDWRAAARGQPWLIKQFAGETGEPFWIDWAEAMPGEDAEARLSQLSLWVIEAERGPAPYGLRLPGREIPQARGEAHLHQCLRALALHPA